MVGLFLVLGIDSGFIIPNIQQQVNAQVKPLYNVTTSQMTKPMIGTMGNGNMTSDNMQMMSNMMNMMSNMMNMMSNMMNMMSNMMNMKTMSNNTTGMNTMSSMHG